MTSRLKIRLPENTPLLGALGEDSLLPFTLSFHTGLLSRMMNFNLVWPTRTATARSHLQHILDSDAAQNRPIRSLHRVVRKVPGPLFGHVYVIDDHNDHADRTYWQCYRQGHFPSDPRLVVTARRHFWRDMSDYYSHVGSTDGETRNFDRGASCSTTCSSRHRARDIQPVIPVQFPDTRHILSQSFADGSHGGQQGRLELRNARNFCKTLRANDFLFDDVIFCVIFSTGCPL